MKWRNLPRLWLFQMLDAHCRPRKYFRVLHVPIRTKLLSANARLSCAVFAVWLIANSTAFAQTVQGSAAQPATTPDGVAAQIKQHRAGEKINFSWTDSSNRRRTATVILAPGPAD